MIGEEPQPQLKGNEADAIVHLRIVGLAQERVILFKIALQNGPAQIGVKVKLPGHRPGLLGQS